MATCSKCEDLGVIRPTPDTFAPCDCPAAKGAAITFAETPAEIGSIAVELVPPPLVEIPGLCEDCQKLARKSIVDGKLGFTVCEKCKPHANVLPDFGITRSRSVEVIEGWIHPGRPGLELDSEEEATLELVLAEMEHHDQVLAAYQQAQEEIAHLRAVPFVPIESPKPNPQGLEWVEEARERWHRLNLAGPIQRDQLAQDLVPKLMDEILLVRQAGLEALNSVSEGAGREVEEAKEETDRVRAQLRAADEALAKLRLVAAGQWFAIQLEFGKLGEPNPYLGTDPCICSHGENMHDPPNDRGDERRCRTAGCDCQTFAALPATTHVTVNREVHPGELVTSADLSKE